MTQNEVSHWKSQNQVLGRWIFDALSVLESIDPESDEEAGEISELIKRGNILARASIAQNIESLNTSGGDLLG